MPRKRIAGSILIVMVGAMALFLGQAGLALAEPLIDEGPPLWAGAGRGSDVGAAARSDGGPPPWAGLGRGRGVIAGKRDDAGPPPWAGIGRGVGNGAAKAAAGPGGTIAQQFFESKMACMDAFFGKAFADFHAKRRTIQREIRLAALSTAADSGADVASLRAALAAAEAEKDAAETAKDSCIQQAEAAKDAALAESEARDSGADD